MLIHIHEPHSKSRQVELGRWRVSEKLFRDYLNVEQAISLAAGFAGFGLCHAVIMRLLPQKR